MQAPEYDVPTRNREQGFAALALVVILVPLLLVVGTYLQTMTGRQNRLQLEIKEEQALLTAESGVDVAIYEAREGRLAAGHHAQFVFTGTLPQGSSYHTVCTYLGDDDDDNDDDLQVDEPDEDVFEVVSTGTCGESTRRIATYLGFSRYLPDISSALTVSNPATVLDLRGSPKIDGRNHLLDGTLARADDALGISILSPGTLANLVRELTSTEGSRVLGSTPAPSLGLSRPLDVPTMIDHAYRGAANVLTNGHVASGEIGTTSAPLITYRDGELQITGNTTGAGLMVVNGDLRLAGTFRWDGVIVVTGRFEAFGTTQVYGAVVLGPATPEFRVGGTPDIRYSAEGIAMAGTRLGRYVTFNGWQEITTND